MAQTPTVQGISYFSTDGGKRPPRDAGPDLPPPIARSDPEHDAGLMIKDLREKWPHICYGVFAPWDVRWYFDEYDFLRLGKKFCYVHVLQKMQKENEEILVPFCQEWSELNKHAFHVVTYLEIDKLFHEKDHARYGPGFLQEAKRYMYDAYKRAAEVEAATVAAQSQPMHFNQLWPEPYPPVNSKKTSVVTRPQRYNSSTSFAPVDGRRSGYETARYPVQYQRQLSESQQQRFIPPPPSYSRGVQGGYQFPFTGPIPYPYAPTLIPTADGQFYLEPPIVHQPFMGPGHPPQPLDYSQFQMQMAGNAHPYSPMPMGQADGSATGSSSTFHPPERNNQVDANNKKSQRNTKNRNQRGSFSRKSSGSSFEPRPEVAEVDTANNTRTTKQKTRRSTSEFKADQERQRLPPSIEHPTEHGSNTTEKPNPKSSLATKHSASSKDSGDKNMRTNKAVAEPSAGKSDIDLRVGRDFIGKDAQHVTELYLRNINRTPAGDVSSMVGAIAPVESVAVKPSVYGLNAFVTMKTADGAREVLRQARSRPDLSVHVSRRFWTSQASFTSPTELEAPNQPEGGPSTSPKKIEAPDQSREAELKNLTTPPMTCPDDSGQGLVAAAASKDQQGAAAQVAPSAAQKNEVASDGREVLKANTPETLRTQKGQQCGAAKGGTSQQELPQKQSTAASKPRTNPQHAPQSSDLPMEPKDKPATLGTSNTGKSTGRLEHVAQPTSSASSSSAVAEKISPEPKVLQVTTSGSTANLEQTPIAKKGEIKVPDKAVSKTTDQTDSRVTGKIDKETTDNVAGKVDKKRTEQANKKPAEKVPFNTTDKADNKPTSKAEIKPDVNASIKTSDKVDSKTAAADGDKTANKVESKTTVKVDSKTGVKDDEKPSEKVKTKVADKTVNKATGKVDNKPASKTDNKAGAGKVTGKATEKIVEKGNEKSTGKVAEDDSKTANQSLRLPRLADTVQIETSDGVHDVPGSQQIVKKSPRSKSSLPQEVMYSTSPVTKELPQRHHDGANSAPPQSIAVKSPTLVKPVPKDLQSPASGNATSPVVDFTKKNDSSSPVQRIGHGKAAKKPQQKHDAHPIFQTNQEAPKSSSRQTAFDETEEPKGRHGDAVWSIRSSSSDTSKSHQLVPETDEPDALSEPQVSPPLVSPRPQLGFGQWVKDYETISTLIDTAEYPKKEADLEEANRLKKQLEDAEKGAKVDDVRLGDSASSAMKKRLKKRFKDRTTIHKAMMDDMSLLLASVRGQIESHEHGKQRETASSSTRTRRGLLGKVRRIDSTDATNERLHLQPLESRNVYGITLCKSGSEAEAPVDVPSEEKNLRLYEHPHVPVLEIEEKINQDQEDGGAQSETAQITGDTAVRPLEPNNRSASTSVTVSGQDNVEGMWTRNQGPSTEPETYKPIVNAFQGLSMPKTPNADEPVQPQGLSTHREPSNSQGFDETTQPSRDTGGNTRSTVRDTTLEEQQGTPTGESAGMSAGEPTEEPTGLLPSLPETPETQAGQEDSTHAKASPIIHGLPGEADVIVSPQSPVDSLQGCGTSKSATTDGEVASDGNPKEHELETPSRCLEKPSEIQTEQGAIIAPGAGSASAAQSMGSKPLSEESAALGEPSAPSTALQQPAKSPPTTSKEISRKSSPTGSPSPEPSVPQSAGTARMSYAKVASSGTPPTAIPKPGNLVSSAVRSPSRVAVPNINLQRNARPSSVGAASTATTRSQSRSSTQGRKTQGAQKVYGSVADQEPGRPTATSEEVGTPVVPSKPSNTSTSKRGSNSADWKVGPEGAWTHGTGIGTKPQVSNTLRSENATTNKRKGG